MSPLTLLRAPLLSWLKLVGVVLLAAALSAPAVARPGPAPAQDEALQHYADYTKDQTVYLNHKIEKIGLSVFFAAVFIWCFGFEVILRLRGDPLPSNIRAAFDRLDAVRLEVRALTLGAKALRRGAELTSEARLYDEIAERANFLLSAASANLRSVAVDKAALMEEIEQLIVRSNAFSARLRTMQPDHLSTAEVGDRIRFGWGFVNRVNRGWRRAFARPKQLKIRTIEQFQEMKWRAWSSIEGLTA
jgi:hypothetical protein